MWHRSWIGWGKVKLHIQINGVKVPKCFDVSLADRINNVTFDGTWEDFKTQVNQVGDELLSFVKKHYKDWFNGNDDNIKRLLKIKHSLHLSLLSSSENPLALWNELLKNTKQSFNMSSGRWKIIEGVISWKSSKCFWQASLKDFVFSFASSFWS